MSLPLAVFLLVRSTVLAACAENVHYFRYEAGKHRLEIASNSINGVSILQLQWSSAWRIKMLIVYVDTLKRLMTVTAPSQSPKHDGGNTVATPAHQDA